MEYITVKKLLKNTDRDELLKIITTMTIYNDESEQ